MRLWDFQLLLEHIRRLDQCHYHAGRHVPFHVAVEGIDARVVGLESDHQVAVGIGRDSVTLHGRLGEVRLVAIKSPAAARDDLVCMSVHVHGMGELIEVVDDDLDDLTGF